MRSRTVWTIGAAVVLGLGLVLPGSALAAGPSPGVILGGDGASWQGHPQRFVTTPSGLGRTLVRELPAGGGPALRSRIVPAGFGIPAVTYNGSAEQVPAASASIVLATPANAPSPRHTRFLVLSTRDLRVQRRIVLRGSFAFDALSPGGTIVYLTQHRWTSDITRYQVRAYDIRRGRLLPGVIADRSTGEWRMQGLPVTRLQPASGGWAYTLYQGGADGAFVHALDTRDMTAHCIDLPRLPAHDISAVRMHLSGHGSRLVLTERARRLAAIDTSTFRVVPRERASTASSGAAIWPVAALVVLIGCAGGVGVRAISRSGRSRRPMRPVRSPSRSPSGRHRH